MRCASLVVLLLVACTPACEDAPLEPPDREPAFVVELSDRGSPERDVGSDAGVPVPETRSTLALYDAEGAIAQDRWLDPRAAWDGARGRFDAQSTLPGHQTPDGVTFLLHEPASVVTLEPVSGAVIRELALPDGGEPLDFFASAETGLLSRADGLSTLDLERGAVAPPLDLSALAGAGSEPARIAPLAEEALTRVIVGLDRPASETGAVLVVELATGVASVLELPGLRGCTEVSALSTGPGEPARAAALCTGDRDLEPSLRSAVGLALLEAEPDGPVRATQIWNVPSPTPPSEALVGASEGWVVMLSRGEPDVRPDVLVAMHLERGEQVVLREEPHSYRYGPALGEGAFNPATREVWWPSVSGGIVRFRLEGEGANAGFVELDPVATPPCHRSPVRRVRHLP